jgi:predicted dehydrogenase
VDSEIDVVIFATPPVFRSLHVAYAVEKGRHVFMEKPVAVDPVGARKFFEIADQADQKKLSIVAGTQRRHEKQYLETIKRIHEGLMGDVVAGQVYWNQGALWKIDRKPGWSDMEHQVRNWLYYTHISGDHVVEQHIHNIDVANWVLQSHPMKAVGVGGRQARVSPDYGHIYDHFAVDFEYPNGARVLSMCRQQEGTEPYVGEHFIGTKGTSNAASWIRGAETFRFEGENRNPYVQEHTDLIESIRNGNPINEARRMAETNLSAIMAREAAYTGQEVTWDDVMASTQDLSPKAWEFGDVPLLAAAVPGLTKLNRRPFEDGEMASR